MLHNQARSNVVEHENAHHVKRARLASRPINKCKFLQRRADGRRLLWVRHTDNRRSDATIPSARFLCLWRMPGTIKTKRWDDPKVPDDGHRLLVCRYRPRGVAKADETWDAWDPH